MPKDGWEREREALQGLTTFLAEECRGGILGEALDYAIRATGAHAGAAFTVTSEGPELAAERGILPGAADRTSAGGPPPDPPKLTDLAQRAIAARRGFHVTDVGRSQLDPELRRALQANGWRAVAAVPVKHLREVLGVILIAAHEPAAFDHNAITFLDLLAHIVAIAAERDRRQERETAYRDQLIETGRMASVGLLTATVAHELRGPVAALALQIGEQRRLLDQLRHDTTPSSIEAGTADLDETLEDMQAAITQIGSTISQLLSVSRRESSPDKLDLGTVAQQALTVLRVDLQQRGIRLVERYGVGCFTTGRRDNLAQVVMNLVMNAADACKTGQRAPEIYVETRVEGSRVVLSVDDSGPGVAQHAVKTIFQPFYTTKARGQGTGLGLKICADVVAAHHGHIEVMARDGGGASFRVMLPRLLGTENESGVHPVAQPLPLRSQPLEVKRVLVVDDDHLLARTLRRALRPHEVRTASTASEAEMALLDPAYLPHLVLCDLSLPGMTGDALYARVKARRPEVAERFIFATGGACSKEEADNLRASGCPTLVKPIRIEDVLTALAAPHPQTSVAPEAVKTLQSGEETSQRAMDASTMPPRAPTRPGR